jgi:hypothetical protein
VKNRTVLGAISVAVLVIVAACTTSGSSPSASPPEPPPEPTNTTETFEACVSPWDGNHDSLEALIRDRLHDPGSMETHSTYFNPDDDIADGEIGIRLNYGARNRLGGMVRSDALAVMRLDCTIAEVVDYGF